MNIRQKILILSLLTVFGMNAFAADGRVLPELVYPTMIDTDGESLFVLDGVTVYVYSLGDFTLRNKFCRRGQGPGELTTNVDLPANMFLYKDFVIVNSFSKIIFFSKKGKLIRERKIPFVTFQILPFSEKYVISKFFRDKSGQAMIDILLLDREFKTVKNIYSTQQLNNKTKGRIGFPILGTFIGQGADKLLVFDQKKSLEFDIYDLKGERISKIRKKFLKSRWTARAGRKKCDG